MCVNLLRLAVPEDAANPVEEGHARGSLDVLNCLLFTLHRQHTPNPDSCQAISSSFFSFRQVLYYVMGQSFYRVLRYKDLVRLLDEIIVKLL